MEYFFFPVYGLIVSSMGLAEITASARLSERGSPEADPIWLFIRGAMLSIAVGTVEMAVYYSALVRFSLAYALLLILSALTALSLLASFLVLEKKHLSYASLISTAVTLVAVPLAGIPGLGVGAASWLLTALASWLLRDSLPEVPRGIGESLKPLLRKEVCAALLVANIIFTWLRLHAILL